MFSKAFECHRIFLVPVFAGPWWTLLSPLWQGCSSPLGLSWLSGLAVSVPSALRYDGMHDPGTESGCSRTWVGKTQLWWYK